MIKEYKHTLHVRLDGETLAKIKSGRDSAFMAAVDFLRTNTRSCDLDDVDDVIIINDRFVMYGDDDTINFDTLAAGKVLIIPECDHVADYADWWK